MKFNEVINDILFEGAKTILSTKDFPDWVKKVFKENDLSFGTISVEANTEPTIGGQLIDHNVMRVFFFSGGKVVKQNAANYDTLINSTDKEKALYQGGKIKLWDEVVPGKPQMILVTHTHPKKAILYVHPNQMPKQIEDKNSDLTDDEKKVLLITKGYTSAYRNEYFKKYGVFTKLDTIRDSLKSKGLLTANKALNVAGKNVIEKLTDGGPASSTLEKLFGYGK
jgi:hypothetical protein